MAFKKKAAVVHGKHGRRGEITYCGKQLSSVSQWRNYDRFPYKPIAPGDVVTCKACIKAARTA